jgi:hypothetical protein
VQVPTLHEHFTKGLGRQTDAVFTMLKPLRPQRIAILQAHLPDFCFSRAGRRLWRLPQQQRLRAQLRWTFQERRLPEEDILLEAQGLPRQTLSTPPDQLGGQSLSDEAEQTNAG